MNLGTCDPSSQLKCNCLPYYTGDDCSKKLTKVFCPTHFNCTNLGVCDEKTGTCLCREGSYGFDCGGSEWPFVDQHPHSAQSKADKLVVEVGHVMDQYAKKEVVTRKEIPQVDVLGLD